jgi:enoyl-CoA hydratase/carnithine racemase
MRAAFECIRMDRNDHVVEVVLSNPGRFNAMDKRFFHEIRDAFRQIDADASVRAAIVWAEGRMFTSGLHLRSTEDLMPPRDEQVSSAVQNMDLYHVIQDFQDCFQQIERTRKPVIAAVHGRCLGGGVDLVTACDIRLCSSDASFAIHETKMAMVADLGTLQRLTGIVGKGLAREMAFTGNAITAERSLAFGLVNAVYPSREALLEGARGLAAEIAANSPFAVQGIKQVLNYSDQHSLSDGLEYVAQWNSSFFVSSDLKEALAAFNGKNTPVFKGD